MTTSSAQPIPPLASPGAGLPKIELLFARLLMSWQARRSTRASAAALFAREQAAVLTLARGCDPQVGRRRTLIKRLAGMEDSSRHWSVYMTLDHLNIVNRQIAGVIQLLNRGQTPPGAASTAAVKPRADADTAVIEEFEQACDHFEQSVAAVGDLRTPARFAHPWFGLRDAADWHFIAAFHQGLHRRQIESILRTLRAEG